MPKQPTYADLFAGAGGLSEGFIRSGYLPIAHVEQDFNACFTLKTRIAHQYLKQQNKVEIYVSYLKREISREALYSFVPSELLETVINKCISLKTLPTIFEKIDFLLNGRTLDVIIGGPPCQAYSVTGRVAHSRKGRWDARKFLYKLYGRFLEKYNPSVFVFENVPGLYSSGNGKYFEQMLQYFNCLDYKVEHKVLDASDFGVIQQRKRIILVGWKKDMNFAYPVFDKLKKHWIVKDLLSDLPRLKAGQTMDVATYVRKPSEYLTKHDIRNGFDFTTQHIARPHNENDLAIYKLVIDAWKQAGNNLKYDEVPAELRTQHNTTAFLDRFKVVRSDALSHTLIAHIAKDGHHYIHPDIRQLRSLSVREAARIQSFPDDYFFEGSRTSAFKQIGNAVPPLMAAQIALRMKGLLNVK